MDFCECQSDQVRLIQMGYIGGAPKHPRNAFSIRLLRLYHQMWLNGSTPISTFAKSLDAFLDAGSGLILSNRAGGESGNNEFKVCQVLFTFG